MSARIGFDDEVIYSIGIARAGVRNITRIRRTRWMVQALVISKMLAGCDL